MQWEKHGTVLILSQVPHVLESAGFDVKELLAGQKLRPFLQAKSEGHFQVIPNERNRTLWGLAPLSAELSAPFERYFPQADSARAPRFASSMWRAFTISVAPGKRRWVFDEPSIHFLDLDAEEPQPDSGIEVERRFIVEATEGGEVETATIIQSIAKWGIENSIDTTRFAIGRKKLPSAKPAASNFQTQNALDQLIAILLPAELSRISLPLDVVARLKSTKVKSGN